MFGKETRLIHDFLPFYFGFHQDFIDKSNISTTLPCGQAIGRKVRNKKS